MTTPRMAVAAVVRHPRIGRVGDAETRQYRMNPHGTLPDDWTRQDG